MRLIDADAFDDILADGEIKARKSRKYVLESAINTIRGNLAQMPSAQPEQKWIPVTNATLPDNGKVVIALGEKGTWDFGTYRGHGDDIHYWHWKKNTFKKVYWWMYKDNALPEPRTEWI